MRKVFVAAGVSFAIASWSGSFVARGQDATQLSATDAPANGVWVSTLDLANKVAIRQPGRGGRGPNGAAPTPPPAPTYSLGGTPYPRTVPTTSDTDFSIDLKGDAVKFSSMVGVDDAAGAGRGSVQFGVWVDGRKIAETPVMKSGDAPKLLTADLAGAKRLTLAVNDGNDGTGTDNANWGGALDHDEAGRAEPARGGRSAGRAAASDRVEPHRGAADSTPRASPAPRRAVRSCF